MGVSVCFYWFARTTSKVFGFFVCAKRGACWMPKPTSMNEDAGFCEFYLLHNFEWCLSINGCMFVWGGVFP